MARLGHCCIIGLGVGWHTCMLELLSLFTYTSYLYGLYESCGRGGKVICAAIYSTAERDSVRISLE